MTMLSSVAERLYWTARYLERAETTARLTNAYTQFVLDIPHGLEPGWKSLISIIDGNAAFEARFKNYTERNVLKFLVADAANPGSVCHAINAARENVRTTRDCLPESCWQLVNELHLYAREFGATTLTRRHRFEVLGRIIARLQQITGLIHSSMTRDQAYRFLRLGTYVECADMTSRVVDVAFATSS
nr:alpha-E domain-containing protein [Erythrobacter sp.]